VSCYSGCGFLMLILFSVSELCLVFGLFNKSTTTTTAAAFGSCFLRWSNLQRDRCVQEANLGKVVKSCSIFKNKSKLFCPHFFQNTVLGLIIHLAFRVLVSIQTVSVCWASSLLNCIQSLDIFALWLRHFVNVVDVALA